MLRQTLYLFFTVIAAFVSFDFFTSDKLVYSNQKAVAYAKTYAGLNDNSCGKYLNDFNQTDCSHFIAHCLHSGGITIKSEINDGKVYCPLGLAVRKTHLHKELNKLAEKHKEVQLIPYEEATWGDIGFFESSILPFSGYNHSFMFCNNPSTQKVKIYAHSNNRNCEVVSEKATKSLTSSTVIRITGQ